MRQDIRARFTAWILWVGAHVVPNLLHTATIFDNERLLSPALADLVPIILHEFFLVLPRLLCPRCDDVPTCLPLQCLIVVVLVVPTHLQQDRIEHEERFHLPLFDNDTIESLNQVARDVAKGRDPSFKHCILRPLLVLQLVYQLCGVREILSEVLKLFPKIFSSCTTAESVNLVVVKVRSGALSALASSDHCRSSNGICQMLSTPRSPQLCKRSARNCFLFLNGILIRVRLPLRLQLRLRLRRVRYVRRFLFLRRNCEDALAV